MIVLGLDTATPATAVALLDEKRRARAAERRHLPQDGERPGHASRLLALAVELLDDARLRFADVDRVAVGLGPGTFTGLRIGVATARALAQATGSELVGVSTLHALAHAAQEQAPAGDGVLAVVDARRGEAFVAGWRGARRVLDPRALGPADLAALVRAQAGPWLAVGDGAVSFRADLEGAGCRVPEAGSQLHDVSARTICELALQAPSGTVRGHVVPDYLRPPDARKPTTPDRQ